MLILKLNANKSKVFSCGTHQRQHDASGTKSLLLRDQLFKLKKGKVLNIILYGVISVGVGKYGVHFPIIFLCI